MSSITKQLLIDKNIEMSYAEKEWCSFMNTISMNILRDLLKRGRREGKEINLWHQELGVHDTRALLNYEYEKWQHMNNKHMIWSTPKGFDQYRNDINVCLIHDTDNVDICIMTKSTLPRRNHWTSEWVDTVTLNLIGKLTLSSNTLCKICEYKSWNIGEKCQPIKKVTLRQFIVNAVDTLNTHNRV